MDVRQMVEAMFSCWMMGLLVIYAVKNSKYGYLIRVEKEGLLKFAKFLLLLTMCRVVYLKYVAPDMVIENIRRITSYLPWQTVPGVFWEDACNALPLVLMEKMYKTRKWFKLLRIPILCLMSLFFGIGHSYEGLWAVLTMTCYIPLTMSLGKKYGFGTIILCHVAYDLITMFTFKIVLGV